jgi:hypothetical protein
MPRDDLVDGVRIMSFAKDICADIASIEDVVTVSSVGRPAGTGHGTPQMEEGANSKRRLPVLRGPRQTTSDPLYSPVTLLNSPVI